MKLQRQTFKKRGFTLVELLVVIAIVATLAGLTIMAVQWGNRRAAVAKTTANMKDIYNALTLLKTEGVNTGYHAPGSYPPYEGSLQDGRRSEFIWWDLVAEKLSIAKRDESDFIWLTPYADTSLGNPISKRKLGEKQSDLDSLIDNPDDSFGGFAMNAELSDAVYDDESQERVEVVRDSGIDDGSNTIFFGEAADSRIEGDETPGWIFTKWENAPQGNYKDSVHCCMIGGNIQLFKNKDLKVPETFRFLTTLRDKSYEHQP